MEKTCHGNPIEVDPVGRQVGGRHSRGTQTTVCHHQTWAIGTTKNI